MGVLHLFSLFFFFFFPLRTWEFFSSISLPHFFFFYVIFFSEASSNPDFQSAELEQIDALLDKAQRMRVCSSSAEQRKKLSKQSLNLASSVYKPSGKADKVTVSLTRLTRLKPDAGQITAAKCMRHSKSRHSKLPKPSSEPAIGSKSGARPLKSLSKPASIASGINTKEKAQKAHNMESEPEFSLQTNGYVAN